MRQVIFNLDASDRMLIYNNFVVQGENLATELVFNLNENFQGYKYFIEFQNNSKPPYVTTELTAVNNVVKYILTNAVTTQAGVLKIQFQAYDDNNKLIKSLVTSLKIEESIYGSAEIVPEAYVPWYLQVFEQANIATTKAEEAAESADIASTAKAEAEAINEILTNPETGTIKQAIDINAELESTITDASTAKDNLQDVINNAQIGDLEQLEETNIVDAVKNNRQQINTLDANYNKRLSSIDPFAIFGVSWNKSSNPSLTRIDSADGFVSNIGVDSNVVVNDFDKSLIWGEMKEITDSLGNVFVRIPKCYIKKTDAVDFKTWQVSKTKYKGFYLPWCFWDFEKNKELDYIDIGKHKASLSADNKLESKPDTYPLINKTIVDFRTYAQANGVDYQQLDIHVVDLLQTLFIIEQGTLHSQSKIAGYTSGQYTSTHLALLTEEATNRIIVTNAQGALYEVGQAISVGTSQDGNQVFYGRTIVEKQTDTPSAGQTSIIFDGDAVNIAIGNYLYNTGYKNGFSKNIESSVGSINSNTSGKHPFVWHGIESLYGDVWQFVDGININEYQTWVCKDASKYASNLFTAPYEPLSYVNANTAGYVKAMGFDENLPFAEFPIDITGDSTTYYSDYYYKATGQRIFLFGGYWYEGAGAGLFSCRLDRTSSYASVVLGGRLIKKAV